MFLGHRPCVPRPFARRTRPLPCQLNSLGRCPAAAQVKYVLILQASGSLVYPQCLFGDLQRTTVSLLRPVASRLYWLKQSRSGSAPTQTVHVVS